MLTQFYTECHSVSSCSKHSKLNDVVSRGFVKSSITHKFNCAYVFAENVLEAFALQKLLLNIILAKMTSFYVYYV